MKPRFPWRKAVCGIVVALLLCVPGVGAIAQGGVQPTAMLGLPFCQSKKVIDFEWAAPSAQYVAGHISAMQKSPFDGIVFYPGNQRLELLKPDAWGSDADAIDHASLGKIRWGSWKGSSFFLVWTSDEWQNNYWNDRQWSRIAANMGELAAAARDCGCAGILLDVETYSERSPWVSADQARGHTLAQTQAQARLRGRQVMAAMQGRFPGITVFSTFTMGLFNDTWDLLPHFMNGMLDALGPAASLIDSNEDSYWWTATEQWYRSYGALKVSRQDVTGYLDPANRRKWRAQVGMAKAAYWDLVLNSNPTLAQKRRWEHNCRTGLETADRYLWVYTERMNWFGVPVAEQPMGNAVPITGVYSGAAEGIRAAKAGFAAGTRPGWDVREVGQDAAVPDDTVTVRLQAPSSVSTAGLPATVPVKVACASANTKTIDLYVNAVRVAGVSGSRIFSTQLHLPPGQYRILARATDANGHTGTANAVVVTVAKR